MSDERNTLVGNLSATIGLKCSGWPFSCTVNVKVDNFERDPVADGKPVESLENRRDMIVPPRWGYKLQHELVRTGLAEVLRC